MRGVWVVVLGVVVVAVATKGEMDRNGCNEEPGKNLKKLTSFFLKPILDQWPSSVKQKRSPNVKPSDSKLLMDQRKIETLCKFCRKSELRMKSLLCKKCVANSQEVIPNLVRSTAEHSNEKSAKFTNKPEERKTENPLNKRDALAHLNSLKTNSNVRDFVFRLIKSPFVNKQTMKTLQIPPATKTTATENIKQLAQSAPLKLRDSSPTIAEFLASFPSNVKSTITSEEGNINKITRDFHPSHVQDTLLENLRPKRLKDIQHNDFLNILKETLKSQETNNNEIQKRNSNHTKQLEDSKKSSDVLKKELFNNILSKYILEISSEEDLSEIIGSSKTPNTTLETFLNENSNFTSTYNHYKSISKRTTEELTTENSPTTIQEKPEYIATSVRNKIGTLYHSRFNYKKHPRERLQYRNRVWVVEKDPPTNMPFENLDEILQKMAPNNIKTTQTNDNNETQNNINTGTSDTTKDILKTSKDLEANSTTRTENSLALELNTVSPTPNKEIITNKPKSALDMFKEIRNQHFLNRHMYLKNPRLKSTYENGKHKYVQNKITEQNWDIFNMTTETTSAPNYKAETDGVNDLLGLVKPTKNTDYEIKKVSTRSVTETPTQEEEEDELVIKIPTSNNILSRINKLSSHGITKRVFPTKLTKLNTLKSSLATKHHDIFSKNLNMNPKINALKYKNIALSMKNNEAKELNPNIVSNLDKEKTFVGNEHNPIKNNDENFSSNEIKTSQDFVSNDAAETDENKLSSAFKTLNNIHATEYKILLPLILKQNKDGTIQLLLDHSQLWANCTQNKNLEEEKNVYKRKTEDNLTKYPLNIFNILDQSSTQANNYLQIRQNDVLKEKFYKYLINEKLFKLFESLNIPVESSAELHSYIDDLPEKERNKLQQYVLNSISNDYNTKHGNTINQELFLEKQSEFMQSLVKRENENKSDEKTTESNRISFQITEEDQTNNLNSADNILKSVIREVILKELENSNLCPGCHKQKCTCNDNIDYPRNDYYFDEDRIIDKRHYNRVPKRENSVIVEPDSLIKKKYKIVNNFLNWARDIVVPTSNKHL